MWQALRRELYPQGLEIVTVALDTGGAEAARPYIEAAHAEHPSLIDQAHITDELFGFVNVPNGVWIDEDGVLVRPAEPAWPPREPASTRYQDIPRTPRAAAGDARRGPQDPNRSGSLRRRPAGLGGPRRRQPLCADPRRGRRPLAAPAAGARPCCRRLRARPAPAGARATRTPPSRWFREAHRLQPDNWTYKRQAWSFADPLQGPTEHYDSDWLSDIRAIGAENYYPPVDF